MRQPMPPANGSRFLLLGILEQRIFFTDDRDMLRAQIFQILKSDIVSDDLILILLFVDVLCVRFQLIHLYRIPIEK